MKQKTAIRQLIEKLNHLADIQLELGDHKRRDAYLRSAHEAQELEPVNEQQIIDAFQANKNWSYAKDKGHIYFNETFEKP